MFTLAVVMIFFVEVQQLFWPNAMQDIADKLKASKEDAAAGKRLTEIVSGEESLLMFVNVLCGTVYLAFVIYWLVNATGTAFYIMIGLTLLGFATQGFKKLLPNHHSMVRRVDSTISIGLLIAFLRYLA